MGEHVSRGFNGAEGVNSWPKRIIEDRLDLVELVRMVGCVGGSKGSRRTLNVSTG